MVKGSNNMVTGELTLGDGTHITVCIDDELQKHTLETAINLLTNVFPIN